MDWQQALSLVLVFITAVLMVRGAMKKKTRTSSSSPCGDCDGCSSRTAEK